MFLSNIAPHKEQALTHLFSGRPSLSLLLLLLPTTNIIIIIIIIITIVVVVVVELPVSECHYDFYGSLCVLLLLQALHMSRTS